MGASEGASKHAPESAGESRHLEPRFCTLGVCSGLCLSKCFALRGVRGGLETSAIVPRVSLTTQGLIQQVQDRVRSMVQGDRGQPRAPLLPMLALDTLSAAL